MVSRSLPRGADTRLLLRRSTVRVFAAAARAARADASQVKRLGQDRLLVLNLHSVSPRRGRLTSPLSPQTLEELVGWLARTCRVGTFRTLAADDPDDARPGAVLTFDDGYRDFLDYAMPVLDRHRVRAIVNVVPTCVETGIPPWNVLLIDLLEQCPPERLGAIQLPGLETRLAGRGRDARLRHAIALSRFLKMRPRAERALLVADFLQQLGDVGLVSRIPMLSARDLIDVAGHHEIGLHSFAHDSMEFESDAFLSEDLRRCVGWAARHLPTTPDIYAFPNGSHRADQVGIARDAGLRDILVGGERSSRVEASAHPRITAYGASAAEVRARVAWALRTNGQSNTDARCASRMAPTPPVKAAEA